MGFKSILKKEKVFCKRKKYITKYHSVFEEKRNSIQKCAGELTQNFYIIAVLVKKS